MGLDVVGYEKLERIGPYDVDLDPEEGTELLEPNDSFLAAADGFEAGLYRVVGRTHDFRAGHYSSYGAWRDNLARLLGTTTQQVWTDGRPTTLLELLRAALPFTPPRKSPPTAFRELICFSDCEGIIGPKTSKKLAGDFLEWEARANEFAATLGDGAEFMRVYLGFREAFALAANDGAVRFC